MRHGQAVSNYLGDLLGPDEWFKVEGTCQYDDKQGTIYNVFDAGVLQREGALQFRSSNTGITYYIECMLSGWMWTCTLI